MADLQNSRRRMEEEKKTLLSYASSQVIQEFLPIIDNFELSFSHLPENLKNEEWIKGIDHILTQSKQILERNGITNIPAKPGDKVDPSLHEVVMKADGKPGEIVEVLQKGYMQNGKVLRTAKVKAA
jgi:molecular chaperone GrpE